MLLRLLRHLRDGLAIHVHLLRDALVRVAVGHAQVLHDQRGVDQAAPEALVLLERGDLLGRAVDRHVAVDAGARVEQDDVEALDLPLLLHAPVHAHHLVEDLEAALLASDYVLAPADEQDPVGHAPLLCSRPAARHCCEPVRPTLPAERCRCKLRRLTASDAPFRLRAPTRCIKPEPEAADENGVCDEVRRSAAGRYWELTPMRRAWRAAPGRTSRPRRPVRCGSRSERPAPFGPSAARPY